MGFVPCGRGTSVRSSCLYAISMKTVPGFPRRCPIISRKQPCSPFPFFFFPSLRLDLGGESFLFLFSYSLLPVNGSPGSTGRAWEKEMPLRNVKDGSGRPTDPLSMFGDVNSQWLSISCSPRESRKQLEVSQWPLFKRTPYYWDWNYMLPTVWDGRIRFDLFV